MRLSRIPLGIAVAMVAAGCSSLQETSASQILASNLTTPNNASLLVNSTVADFECAYAQYIMATGLVSDELYDTQFLAIGWDYDRRTLTANSAPLGTYRCEDGLETPGLYTPLSIARFDGDNALKLLNGWTDAQVPGRGQLIGETAAYTGFVLTFMGETMCASALDGGPSLKPDSLLGLADSHFTAAITAATTANDTASLNMAIIGRARERLDRGHTSDAAADAALLTDTTFKKFATYDATTMRRENRVWTEMFRELSASVEGPFQGLTYNGVADNRVLVVDSHTPGADAHDTVWQAQKYDGINAPIPIAQWSETQLIIAENDLANNNVAGADGIITLLHARQGLAAYTSTNPDSVKAQLIDERRRELFLEGRRLGDIIHYALPLNPAAGAPYNPIKGGQYGSQLCFPLPTVEILGNPNA